MCWVSDHQERERTFVRRPGYAPEAAQSCASDRQAHILAESRGTAKQRHDVGYSEVAEKANQNDDGNRYTEH
jgi:hypothetical protein